jgi:hypothetical protein
MNDLVLLSYARAYTRDGRALLGPPTGCREAEPLHSLLPCNLMKETLRTNYGEKCLCVCARARLVCLLALTWGPPAGDVYAISTPSRAVLVAVYNW